LEEAIAGRAVKAAVFTTFRFEPAFFEQEVVPALFDRPYHHVPALRLLQLEQALRSISGRVAVYYDQRALAEGDRGSAALDVRRIPCRLPGRRYFHPKNLLILVEGSLGPALVVATGSANLTRAGWWENVEAVSFDELPAGGHSRMRDGLLAFLDHLRRLTARIGEHGALDDVRTFLRAVAQTKQRSSRGRLHPHVLSNGRRGAQNLVDFMDETAGGVITGSNLEVISPYLDDADTLEPLAKIVLRFRPREVCVLLPEENGLVPYREALYEYVKSQGWSWGRLPEDLVSGGDGRAMSRRVHAKVYRFFTADREIVVVGSANLTTAGHGQMGNIETVVLRETSPSGVSWLSPIDDVPSFGGSAEEAEDVDDDAHPLVIRYDWTTRTLEALWEGNDVSPDLRMLAHGVDLFGIDALPTDRWCRLKSVDLDRFEEHLRSSSLLTAVTSGGISGVILVLETGMAHRPSLLLELTTAEILQYWALLSADQRAAYIAEKGERLVEIDGGENLVAPVPDPPARPMSMFDRFAGIFHGFASLERAVVEALEDGRDPEAVFLVFGAKPDSLPLLVDRTAKHRSPETLTDDYLLLLCAEQLVRRLRQDWPDFWSSDPGAGRLQEALASRDALRTELVARNGDEIAPFLDWYERQFLKVPREPTA
jgi:hypothetical protein